MGKGGAPSPPGSAGGVLGSVALNVATVVGVVLLNKWIVQALHFPFVTFLSFLHFLLTALACRALLAAGYMQYKPAALAGVLPVAVGSLGSVAFMNLSLSHNSVGVYQLAKVAVVPATLALQRLMGTPLPPPLLLATLVPLCVGVTIATVYDLTLTPIGAAYAAAAVAATAAAQIFTSSSQASLGCNALQLLFHTSPLIALGMLLLVPIFDDMQGLFRVEWTTPLVSFIFLSAVAALGVNISNYEVLGRTSPLTYQVLGHFKTVLILVLGYMLFRTPVDARGIFGVVLALAGVIAFTEVKRRMALAPVLPAVRQERSQ